MTSRYVKSLRAPLRNLLAVPIMHDRKVIGVVEVYNKIPQGKAGAEGFSRDDQQILQGVSEHMAIAMMKLNLIQYDALTGLLRPDPFFEKVLQKVNAPGQRRREQGGRALVMGDVDWFKAYNDRNGHEAGNRLLRELAHVLKLSIREEDLLCRYGGEEFLILLPGCNGSETRDKAERLRETVARAPVDTPAGILNITMSVGGVATADWPDDTANQILQMADLALYRAKEQGRNRTVIAGAAEHEEAHHASLELSSRCSQKS